MRRNVARLAVVLVLSSMWTAAVAADLAEIKKTGMLTVVTFPHQESTFSRTDLTAGPTPALGTAANFEGVDIDLMEAFAGRLGVELQFRRVSEPSYAMLIPDLLTGRGDLVASSLSITEERKKLVKFSDPYFTVEQVIVTPVESPLADVEALLAKRAVVIRGSSHAEHLRKLGVPEENMLLVGFTLECFTAVADGEADYTLADSAAAETQLRADEQLEISFSLPGKDDYGFAVPKESAELLAALNEFVAEMRTTGKLDEIIARHLQLE